MSAKKIVIPIVVAAIVACGVGYCGYNIVKANTVSENTTSSSSSSKTNTTNTANTNSSSQQTQTVASSNSDTSSNTDITSNKVVSSKKSSDNTTTSTAKNETNSTSNSNTSNVKGTTTKSENTTNKTTSNTDNSSTKATSSNNGRTTSSTSNSSDTNSSILSYMGIWNPSTEALWDEDYTKNILPTTAQLNESKIILTKSEYSFGNIEIKNPKYIIVKRTSAYIFANMRMGGYCPPNNKPTQAYGADGEDSVLEFIVAVPQGATSSYIDEVTEGFNILNYPYIVNGKLYAMLNSSENPIYEFSKQ